MYLMIVRQDYGSLFSIGITYIFIVTASDPSIFHTSFYPKRVRVLTKFNHGSATAAYWNNIYDRPVRGAISLRARMPSPIPALCAVGVAFVNAEYLPDEWELIQM